MKKVVFLLVFLSFSMGCRSQNLMNTTIKPDVVFSPLPTIGIMALTSNPPEYGAAVSDAIGAMIMTPDITVIERGLLNELQHKVDYVIMGSATTVEKRSSGGTKWSQRATHYTMIISAAVRIVDASNGEVVAMVIYTVPKNLWLYPDLIGNEISKEIVKCLSTN